MLIRVNNKFDVTMVSGRWQTVYKGTTYRSRHHNLKDAIEGFIIMTSGVEILSNGDTLCRWQHDRVLKAIEAGKKSVDVIFAINDEVKVVNELNGHGAIVGVGTFGKVIAYPYEVEFKCGPLTVYVPCEAEDLEVA